MRILNIVRERKCENWSTTDSFLINDDVLNPEEAMRNAIKDFMQSEQGKKSINYACGDFNWGDAMMDITDEFLKPHGIYRYQEDIETVLVNQDEILFPEIQESILDTEK